MKKLLFFLLALSLALSGCEGGTVTSGVHGECKHTGPWNPTSTCLLTIESIDGTNYTYEVHNDYFRTASDAADVRMTITVGSGVLRVWMQHPDEQVFDVVVRPGETAELNGLAWVWGGSSDDLAFYVYLEPQGEGETNRVEDVHIEFTYTIPGVGSRGAFPRVL
jgi:hypothetical protein